MCRYLLSAALGLCFVFNNSASAQPKFGHLNTVLLMDSLEEAKMLADQLVQYEALLTKSGEEMIAKYQANFLKYQQELQAGNLTPKQQTELESNLELEQNAIDNYRKSAQESLEKRRQELLKPLLEKINKAIREVALEGQYTTIFDSSKSMLFVTESLDVFPQVFLKLNPKPK